MIWESRFVLSDKPQTGLLIFPPSRTPPLFHSTRLYIYRDPWYTHHPSVLSVRPSDPLFYFVLSNTAARDSSASARVDIPDLTFPFVLPSSLFEQRGKNRWMAVDSEAETTPFDTSSALCASVTLRALSSHLSSAISQRCWLSSGTAISCADFSKLRRMKRYFSPYSPKKFVFRSE